MPLFKMTLDCNPVQDNTLNHCCDIIMHSPPGMPYGFGRFLIFCLFFRRQGFQMITFERQDGLLRNFCQSWVKGRSVSTKCDPPPS